jgi:hypothetical protein
MEDVMKTEYSLWGNGGGDDVLIEENVTPIGAALKLMEDNTYQR